MAVATSTALAYAAVAAAAASAYTSYQGQKEAAEAQEEQERISSNQAKIQQDSNRRQQIREERVRRASIEQMATNTGTSKSSGEIGSTGALNTLTSGNIASSFQADRTTDTISSLSGDVADARLKVATAQAVGKVAGAVYGAAGGAGTIFDSFQGAQASAGSVNTQGQQTSLFDNTAFIKNY